MSWHPSFGRYKRHREQPVESLAPSKDTVGRYGPSPDRPGHGALFGGAFELDDIETETIYALRSLSHHPFAAEHRELIHKIAVTGDKAEGSYCMCGQGRHLFVGRCGGRCPSYPHLRAMNGVTAHGSIGHKSCFDLEVIKKP